MFSFIRSCFFKTVAVVPAEPTSVSTATMAEVLFTAVVMAVFRASPPLLSIASQSAVLLPLPVTTTYGDDGCFFDESRTGSGSTNGCCCFNRGSSSTLKGLLLLNSARNTVGDDSSVFSATVALPVTGSMRSPTPKERVGDVGDMLLPGERLWNGLVDERIGEDGLLVMFRNGLLVLFPRSNGPSVGSISRAPVGTLIFSTTPPFCSEKCVTVTVSVVSEAAGSAAIPLVNGSVGDSTLLLLLLPLLPDPPPLDWTRLLPVPSPKGLPSPVVGEETAAGYLPPDTMEVLLVGDEIRAAGADVVATIVVTVVWPPVAIGVVVPVRFSVNLSPPFAVPIIKVTQDQFTHPAPECISHYIRECGHEGFCTGIGSYIINSKRDMRVQLNVAEQTHNRYA
uniref:Putative secreted protein n=1 Tax=Anopheles triannulatus TaxID=58253 RepID=A0A2M4B0W3_9DIPT